MIALHVMPITVIHRRYWYKEILAEIAESTLLNHLLTQIYGEECNFKKINPNLSSLIRNSNYGLS